MIRNTITDLIKRIVSSSITKMLAILLLLIGGCEKEDQWAKPETVINIKAKRNQLIITSASLGRASDYTVLAGNSIKNNGESRIQGDVGVGSNSITGFQTESKTTKISSTRVSTIKGEIVGNVNTSSAQVEQALNDALLFYYSIINQTPDIVYNSSIELDEQTLTPGIYCFPLGANLSLNGTLTLDFQGNDQAIFVFQVGSSLTAMSNSNIVAINTINPISAGENVFWVVSSSSIVSGSSFIGNVISLGDISMSNTGNVGATNVLGRVISLRGSLTMIRSNISICSNPAKEINPQINTHEYYVTGGGSIERNVKEKENKAKERNKATFGLSYGIKKGEYWGLLSFVDHTNKDIRLKGISIKSFSVIDLSTLEIKGIAKVNNQDSFDYTLIVKDNGEDGIADYFAIKLSNGFEASGPLTDGKIQFHILNTDLFEAKPFIENNSTPLVKVSHKAQKAKTGANLYPKVMP